MSAVRSHDQIILELGQALTEKPEGESLLQEGSKTCILLNEIKQIYLKKKHAQEEREKEEKRRERAHLISIVPADVFMCWQNCAKRVRHNGCRLLQNGKDLYTTEVFKNYDEANKAKDFFLLQEVNLDNWQWISEEDLVKQQMEEFGVQEIPVNERFELWTFTWQSKRETETITMHEVFCYDKMLRFISESKAHSGSPDVPVKTTYDDVIGYVRRLAKDPKELNRLLRIRCMKVMDSYLAMSKDYKFEFHKIILKEKVNGIFESYEVDPKVYKLTDDCTFVEAEEGYHGTQQTI